MLSWGNSCWRSMITKGARWCVYEYKHERARVEMDVCGLEDGVWKTMCIVSNTDFVLYQPFPSHQTIHLCFPFLTRYYTFPLCHTTYISPLTQPRTLLSFP